MGGFSLQITPLPMLDGSWGRCATVSCPARTRLPTRNGLVNKVKFLGLLAQME